MIISEDSKEEMWNVWWKLEVAVLKMTLPKSNHENQNLFEFWTKNVWKNPTNDSELSDVTLACSDGKQLRDSHSYSRDSLQAMMKPISRKDWEMGTFGV